MTFTNYDLKQQLKQVVNSKSNVSRSISSSSINAGDNEIDLQVSIENRKFNKIGNYGKEVIFYDNSTATILQPMPCMRWSCKKTPDANGVTTLDKELECTVLTVGNTNIVLGYSFEDCGVSTELELLIDLGDSELLMNNNFFSTKAKTHAKDGVNL